MPKVKTLTPAARRVLANLDGHELASNQEIADLCDLNKYTVIDALGLLRELGYIEIERHNPQAFGDVARTITVVRSPHDLA